MMTDQELATQLAKHRGSSTNAEAVQARAAIVRAVRMLASDPVPDVPDKSEDWRRGYRAGIAAFAAFVEGFVEGANEP